MQHSDITSVTTYSSHSSLVLKSSTQPRSRRTSVAGSRAAPNDSASASAMDELDDLILEFGDDQLGDQEMDPAIGEDDLLQELSEMMDD